jgi:4-hydroxy-tetrahydrodipicolinate synthase
VRDAVDRPVIAYDIPVCVNIKLERQTTVTLAREGTVAGLKDSSGDDGNFPTSRWIWPISRISSP